MTIRQLANFGLLFSVVCLVSVFDQHTVAFPRDLLAEVASYS